MDEKIMVEIQNATKQFRETTALQDVSVCFLRGQIHGIIGRNGSGKTVLLKCICGLMQLTEGCIYVDGRPVQPGQAQDVGAIIETPGFLTAYSGYENLRLLAAIRHRADKARIREVISAVGLDPDSRKHVGKYSLGMRQRLGIAQAIMEKPSLLILDEPMNGLDSRGVQDMRILFSNLREQGTTILLASHNTEDIAMLCDTVCRMEDGQLIKVSGWEKAESDS